MAANGNDIVRVLLVDDDRDDYVLTRDLLNECASGHYELDWKQDYNSGLVGICSGCYDVVLLDYRLGAKTGLDLLDEARTLDCHTPVILLTGLSDAHIDLAAMQGGAADYLEKSRLDATLLERTIRYSIQQKQIETELERRVRERTEQLDRVNEALREADRRKDEFLTTLAHELRNPLAPIRNAIEILRLSDDRPDAIAMARPILERQVLHLVRLVEDLLDVSRVTRGKLRLIPEPFDLRDAIADAVEQSRPLLLKAEQTFQLDIPSEPLRVVGDRVRLSQVFANLLNNSAKYSEPGGSVVLTTAHVDAHAIVAVRDTGLGIPAEVLPHIFDLFSQVDRTLNRAQGGLGIGLSLVHRLIEMHGGTVVARSDGPGRGAEFVVTLPTS
ncbi:MAG: hybrid sensor histidine kinase/response regulator [Gemmataceae bacterium]